MSGKKDKKNTNNYECEENLGLPECPQLEIYKESFGGLINVTDEWYKNNRE